MENDIHISTPETLQRSLNSLAAAIVYVCKASLTGLSRQTVLQVISSNGIDQKVGQEILDQLVQKGYLIYDTKLNVYKYSQTTYPGSIR